MVRLRMLLSRVILFLCLIIIGPVNLFAQSSNVQKFNLSFQNSDGIYGTVTLKTQPKTLGYGYIKVAVDKIQIDGINQQTDLSNCDIDFPIESEYANVTVSGIACIPFNGTCNGNTGDFKMDAVHMTDFTEVNFPQSVKDQHNKIRKERKVNSWETIGKVTSLRIIGDVSANIIRDLKFKIDRCKSNKASSKSEKEEVDKISKSDRSQTETEINNNNEIVSSDNVDNSVASEVEKRNSETQSQAELEQKEREAELQKQREAEQQRQREAELKKQEEQRRYQEQLEYQRRRAQRQKELNRSAAAVSSGMMMVFYNLGTLIYKDQGMYLPKHRYRYFHNGTHLFLNTQYGYSQYMVPMIQNTSVLDVNNNLVESSNATSAFPTAFEFKAALGAEHPNAAIKAYGRAAGGIALLFSNFMYSYGFGWEGSAGIENLKIYYGNDFNTANHSILRWWDIDFPEGETNLITSNQRFGLEVISGGRARTHVKLGLIQEGILSENYISYVTDIRNNNPGKSIEDWIIPGYEIEIAKDHYYRFFIQYYPKYPYTGIKENRKSKIDSDGGMFLRFGYHVNLINFNLNR